MRSTPGEQEIMAHSEQKMRLIRCHMFLKEKYLSTGVFDKLKARLVAGGNMQDRSNYGKSDFTAPTVS
jgi:hypothetical protein